MSGRRQTQPRKPAEGRRLRKAREREFRRAAILETAEAAFIRHGYAHASVADIAAAAGFSVGTVYNLFRDKEDLYASVLRRHHEELTCEFDALVARTPDPPAAVAAIMRLFLDRIGRHRNLAQMVFSHDPSDRLLLERTLRRHHDPFIAHYSDTLTDLFRRGVAEGRFLPLEPECLTLCFQAFLFGFVRFWSQNPAAMPFETLTEKAVQTFLTAIRAPEKPMP